MQLIFKPRLVCFILHGGHKTAPVFIAITLSILSGNFHNFGSSRLDKSLARFALSLMKKDLRILSGLLTGHADLNRHLEHYGSSR